jgi:hypothetical protein
LRPLPSPSIMPNRLARALGRRSGHAF